MKVIHKLIKYWNIVRNLSLLKKIRDYIGISSKRYVASNIIKSLIENGSLDYTNKNGVNVRNQKYVTIVNN